MNAAIVQIGVGGDYAGMVEDHRARHESYCKRWGFDFIPVTEMADPRWGRLTMVRDLLDKYEYVVYLDSDTLVANLDVDLRDALPCGDYGMVMHPFSWPYGSSHWNAGVVYARSTEMTKLFLTAAYVARFPDPEHWLEQNSINHLLWFHPKWQAGLVTLPHVFNCNIHNQDWRGVIVAAWHGYLGKDTVGRRRAMREWAEAHPF